MKAKLLPIDALKTHHLSRCNTHRLRQLADIDQSDISLTPLYATQITARQATFQCQSFLRKPTRTAQCRQMATKSKGGRIGKREHPWNLGKSMMQDHAL
jgi:hypothetical protein